LRPRNLLQTPEYGVNGLAERRRSGSQTDYADVIERFGTEFLRPLDVKRSSACRATRLDELPRIVAAVSSDNHNDFSDIDQFP
jgi:hypothetical protein